MTSLMESLEDLGELMAENLVTKGVSDADPSDGLTTLANKILQIAPGPGPTPTVASVGLSADKSILSYADSESATLSATVLDENDDPMEGVTVTFYNGSTSMGTADTNSSGVATKSYASTGAGDLSFTASVGTISSETYSIEDCLLYQDMDTIISDWSKDTSVSGRTIYKLTPNYQSDVELTFKIANSVPSNFLCGFGETGTGSPIYWGKAMFHRENGTLWYFVDNSDIRLGSSVSTNTVFKLTTENLHKVNAYLDDSLQAYRDTNTGRGLNLRIDSYTATPLTLQYLKVKPL